MIPSSCLDWVPHTALMLFLVNTLLHHQVSSTGCVNNLYTPKMLMSLGLRSHKAHEDQMWSSSLDCNGLQPAQYLLKSLSWVGTDFQYCNWLRCRGNDFIHSEKWLHFYEAHCARHIPEKGKNINLLILIDVKCLQGRIFKMLAFCLEDQYIDSQTWKYGCNMIALPLVEQNEHRDSLQCFCREHCQQLDTGRRHLSNVDWIHHELWQYAQKQSKKLQGLMYVKTKKIKKILHANLQWQKSSLHSNLAI